MSIATFSCGLLGNSTGVSGAEAAITELTVDTGSSVQVCPVVAANTVHVVFVWYGLCLGAPHVLNQPL